MPEENLSSEYATSDPEVIRLVFMLNSTEHEIYPAHVCKNMPHSSCLQFKINEQDK